MLLRREGWHVNQKRIQRIYNELGLQLRNKTPKRWIKAKLREDPAPVTRTEKMEASVRYYNEDRPHGAIGNKPLILLQNPGGAPSPPL